MARPSDRRSSSSPRKRSATRADARGPAGRDREPPRRRRAAPLASIESLMARQPWSALVPLIARAGVPTEPALTRLRTFAKLVIGWNRGVSNLISKNDESRIVTRHLVESIEPASWLAETAAERWIDFGSGAGFPAIPLAILGIGRSWTLVESRRPKTLFMRKT